MKMQHFYVPIVRAILLLSAASALQAAPLRYEPLAEIYRDYRPEFVEEFQRSQGSRGAISDEEMKLSSEKSFFTLNLLDESDRANALVEAGKQKEAEGQYREALEIYQKVIDEYPDAL
ncbi:MAG: tetratricopeptide repeat protein, partial [Kiritimatiellia bacterium]